MSGSRDPLIVALRRVADPVTRAARAQQVVEGAVALRDAALGVRDDAIRAARAAQDRLTVDELAAAVVVRRNVVVEACRNRGRS